MAACAVCGGSLAPAYEVRDLLLETEGAWMFATCAACGHGQLDPRPTEDELGALYRGLYTPENLDIMERLGSSWFERGLHRKRLNAIAAAATPTTALDVGCGLGYWLKALGERFDIERTGLDMSPQAAARAREVSGAEIIEAPFDADAPAGPFELVTLQHVLEHVPEPAETLALCAERVASGGLLQLEVPQLDGWGRRWFKRWYWGHLPPQHIHLFRLDGLRRLLDTAGFELVSSHTSSYPVLATTTLVLAVRYTVGSRSRYARNWLIRGPVVLFGLSLLPHVILFDLLIGPLLGRLGQGDVLTVVARKR